MQTIRKILAGTGSVFITILLIAGIAFYLFNQSPVPLDEGHYLSEESGHFDRNAIEERKGLVQTGKELGLDKPVFYFSLHSSLYPEDIHQVLPLRERNSLLALSRQSGRKEKLVEQRAYLLSLLDKELDYDLKVEVLKLLSAKRLGTYLSDFLQLQQKLPENNQFTGPAISATEKELANWHHYIPRFQWHGLNNRWHQQLVDFIRLDWGQSWIDSRPVYQKVGDALPWTLIINGIALILLFGLSIPLGRYWALHPRSFFTKISKQTAYLFTVAPVFWIATLAIAFLTGAYGLEIFTFPTIRDFQTFSVHAFMLPLLVLFTGGIGYLARQFEDRYKLELEQAYIKMSLARGISKSKVLGLYATKNALLPLITLAGASLPALISGSLVIEVLFNIPGMGRLIWFSLYAKDWPIIYAVVLLIGFMAWLGRWGADSISNYIDPRTKMVAA